MKKNILLLSRKLYLPQNSIIGLDEDTGDFVRLVQYEENQFDFTIKFEDGTIPKFLDAVEVDVAEAIIKGNYPENWYINNLTIKKKDNFNLNILKTRVEKDLRKHQFIFYNNWFKIYPDFFPNVDDEGYYSIHIAEVDDFNLIKADEYKFYGEFTYQGRKYREIRIKDPEVIEKYNNKKIGYKQHIDFKLTLVFSLEEIEFNPNIGDYENHKVITLAVGTNWFIDTLYNKYPTDVADNQLFNRDPDKPWNNLIELEHYFPDYVIILKNKYYYTAYNASAIILSNVMGYSLEQSQGRLFSGGPDLEKIQFELKNHNYNHLVVEYGKIVLKFEGEDPVSAVKHNLEKRKETLFNAKTQKTARKISEGEIIELSNNTTSEIERYKLYEPKREVKYIGAGGAYYGARTETIIRSDFGLDENGFLKISTNSPLGKKLIINSEGDEFNFKRPDGKIISYKILSIKSCDSK